MFTLCDGIIVLLRRIIKKHEDATQNESVGGYGKQIQKIDGNNVIDGVSINTNSETVANYIDAKAISLKKTAVFIYLSEGLCNINIYNNALQTTYTLILF